MCTEIIVILYVSVFQMKIKEIAFFKQFKCLEGSCSETCCRGWMIPITAQDRKRFRDAGGMLKLSTELAIKERDIVCFNSGSGECPFHNRNGLCSLQLKKGHDFIPEACRMFPRFYRNYGAFEEHYIDLSCIGASRLFLNNTGSLTLTEGQGEALSGSCTTNDDIAFLDALLDTRSTMLRRLDTVCTLNDLQRVFDDICSYAGLMQDAYLSGNTEYPLSHPFAKYHNGQFTKEENDRSSDGCTSNGIFPLNVSVITSVMNTSFYNIRLRHTNPTLYRLCRLYFDKCKSVINSEDKYEALVKDFSARHKEAANYLAAYYAYYLYLYYLKCYEDYSFVRNVKTGMIHTGMILMFSLLYEADSSSLTKDELARIIAVYNRRAYFNDEILDEMYRCLDPS